MDIVISDHARFEMDRRQIDESLVLAVVKGAEQVLSAGKGRAIHQSRYHDPTEAKEMLLRAISERRSGSLYVITVYKTSRVEKYWRKEAER